MSIRGPLVDRFGRVHTDLRVSVTDRCNLRCVYCMPAEGVEFRPHSAILSFEEIERFVAIATRLGVRKVRITGGDPLVRRGILDLVRLLAAVPGITDLAMTTNGILLGDYAHGLRAAGVRRLNISLDTLDREKFQQISRRDELARVLRGIEAACRAGFDQIKLNTLAIRGQTEDEIVPLARFAREYGLEVRFIEFMPLDAARQWQNDRVLSAREILRVLQEDLGPLEPILPKNANAPATEYRFLDGGGRVGVIASVTEPFCDECNRLRLTAEGKVRNCLFSTEEWDVRNLLRNGATDERIAELLHDTVGAKKKSHGTESGAFAAPERVMYQIGG
ncbi:MAG: GTP 3',8-cyclase MoaA [Pirellulales bacterium]|nr:GTP 3',8-cyclase MoaA [Pirellulales bacterium]